MKKLFTYKALWLLLLLPMFSGCNDSDDVAAIFTHKTWKLNYITEDSTNEMFDFWNGDAAERKKSLEKLNLTGSYLIKFEGSTEGDLIKGNVSGITIIKAFNGTWNANSKNNNFKASVVGSNEDMLSRNFLEGINKATSYKGSDNSNLYLLYKSGARTFRMVFRVVK